MKKQERIGGLLWLLLGVGVCIGAASMRMGSLHKPGPGFMPLLAGGLLGLFGLILLLTTFSASGDEKRPRPSKSENWGKRNLFLFCLVALFGYAFLLEPLGFYTTTGVFLFSLFKLADQRNWVKPLISAGLTVLVSYLLFTVWLKIQFPGGVTGF